MNRSSKLSCNAGLLLFVFLVSILSFNCNRASKTLLELGDEKVSLGEFEKQYLKTQPNPDSAKTKPMEDKRQFLDMYIKFRLKIKDARERGLLNNPDMQKEIADYKKTFSPNYLIDKEVVETELHKLYERKKEEVRASHILITLQEKAAPQDSIAAYQKADSIIQKLKDGQDFAALADAYSQDRSVKTNHGDLYYFTAGMTVDEFEDAIYNMKVGEYSKEPVRTAFGLHIIKLTDRKPRFESVRGSHILLQDVRDTLGNVVDSMARYQKALEIYNKAKNGEDFNALAAQYSEDAGSKDKGGDLGYFDRRRLTQPMDSAIFSSKIGEIKGPIRTQYGWHIVKKTDEKSYRTYDEIKETIKNDYKKTIKYKNDYQKYVNKLKTEYNFKFNDGGYAFLRGKLDSTKTLADYNLDSLFTSADKENVLANYDGGVIKVADILNYQTINRDYQRSQLTDETIKAMINAAVENPILNMKAVDAKIEKDDEYEEALREYENGLLVFKVDQDELWTKVKLEDKEILSYYDANKTKYTKLDSAGNSTFKTFEEVKPTLSNELQQAKFKDIELNYINALKAKYPVKVHEDVFEQMFKE
ncbi:MAG: hypothetical protein EHM58_13165 [Ignavibacteriae bacterium]|nr:MAG: hypothetical protein EHM58_13165 [Ignavibacteriota bacterium]